MELTTGAAALAVGTAVDLLGVGDWAVLAVVDVVGPVGVAAPVGELAGLVAVGLGVVAVTVGCAEGRALAAGVD